MTNVMTKDMTNHHSQVLSQYDKENTSGSNIKAHFPLYDVEYLKVRPINLRKYLPGECH